MYRTRAAPRRAGGTGLRRAERRVGLLQPRAGLALLGDVDEEALHVLSGTGLVANDDGLVVHPDRAPVGMDEPVLPRPALVAALEDLGMVREHLLAVVGMDDRLEEILLEPALGRIAEHRLDGGVDVDRLRALVGLIDVERQRQLLDQAPVPDLRLPFACSAA